MNTNIILPVTPEMADKIFNGHKRCIYSNKMARKDIHKILIFVSEPVNMIMGEAYIKDIQRGIPEVIWNDTKNSSFVGLKLFKKTYSYYDELVAYKIKNITSYNEPKPLIYYGLRNKPKTLRYVSEIGSNDEIQAIETPLKKCNIDSKTPLKKCKNKDYITKSIKKEKWYKKVITKEGNNLIIYPEKLTEILKINIEDAYEILDSFEPEINCVLRIICPFCGTADSKIYNSYNELPIYMKCENCNKKIKRVMNNANIIYIIP